MSSFRPAFYAAGSGRWRDWWTLLHPPYTAWHLSYVALGAAVAPRIEGWVLAASLLAFFLAVGIGAHALDELNGRPLDTAISARVLTVTAAVSIAAAVVLGALVVPFSGLVLVPLILLGVVLVAGYNLELFGGRLHTDLGFALSWGGFPVLVGYVAQAPPARVLPTLGAVAVTAAAVAASWAQRRLSTPARELRRRTRRVSGTLTLSSGAEVALDVPALLAPFEAALRSLSWAFPLIAIGAVLARIA